jgi:C4-dicarboxylate-specific signal transduction histidine kinase
LALPLRRQIVILNLAILVPVFAVIAWSARQTYNEQVRALSAEALSHAATIVVYLQRGLDMTAIQTVLESVPLPENSVLTVTDNRSTVLARSREPAIYVGKPADRSPLRLEDVPRTVIRPGLDGVERVYGNAVFDRGPWLVSVGIPTAVALQRVAPTFRRNLAIGATVTLLTLLVEFLIVRRYIRAFDRAVISASQVASGDLTPPTEVRMPSLELERLQDAFVEMVNKLRQAREALSAQVLEERRIREELELLQRQVIRQERLAAIGVLVSGVAHELNNPLQAILGFAELLQMQQNLPPQIKADLELIQKESVRASAIIRNLSRFGRQQTPDPTPIRLRDVVTSVIELRQRKLEENNIELVVDARDDQHVMAIFTELQQVVLNFFINAEQAVLAGTGPRRIVVRTTDSQDRVRLELQDSGPGVPRSDEPKLFQPFFTTKAVGDGTGLGLSVSYGIIESHGGTIGYRAGSGGGALFYFDLPAAPTPASAPAPSA